MRKVFLLIVLAAMVGFLGGCGGSSSKEKASADEPKVTEEETNKEEAEDKEPAKQEPVEDPNTNTVEFENMTVNIPKSYTEVELDEDPGLPIILYSTGDGASFNIVVEDVSSVPGITLEKYIDLSISNTGYDYISNEYITINGKEANQVVSVLPNGVKLQQTTMLHNEKAYIFTYGNMPEKFDTHLSDVEKIINSAVFND